MQISKIQNNNLQNTNFKAHFRVTGQTDTVNRKIFDQIRDAAEKIGRRDDIIHFHIGKPVTVDIPAQFPNMHSITQRFRRIFVTSIINENTRKKSIGYCVFGSDKSDARLMGANIRTYFDELSEEANKEYSKKYNKR